MTYDKAMEFINESAKYGWVPGLETVTELLRRLQNPQEQLKIIHVGGTNGKGSTCAFLTAILNRAGYRVGRYISPSVFSYREKIQISHIQALEGLGTSGERTDQPASGNKFGESTALVQATKYITKEGICRTIELIQPACESMVRDGFPHPTTFEIETAMAFLYFLWEQVDLVVLEVGMGGRLDATNVIGRPVLSIITSISMDHMQYLGDSLTKIAAEKAGIIKPGCPVVSCEQEPELLEVLRNKAAKTGSALRLADSAKAVETVYSLGDTRFTYEGASYRIGLLGKHQVKNAVLAIEAARMLIQAGYSIREEAIRTGLSTARWPGRLELISIKPYLVLDGAHNEDAALNLRESIQTYFPNRRLLFILGVLADKDYHRLLRIMAPLADTIYTLTPETPRALRSDLLAEEAARYCDRVIDAGNAREALKLAYEEAGDEDVILSFGSLSFLGDLQQAFKEGSWQSR
jgi:dihydrofolate synthase/folylpolyglutamate synthase